MPLERSHAEILGAYADAIKHDIRKCLPATITAVHADRQTVDVQIAVNALLFDPLGNPFSEPAPSLADVPLGVMRGGGFLVWVPVAVGDSVLLVFSDLSTDTWRAGDGTARDPGWAGRHTCDSPFALPCVAPDAKFLASPNADPGKVIIGKDGGTAQIRISASDIELGAPAGDFVALASKVATELGKISTALTSIVTSCPAGVGTGTVTYTPGAVASTLVKCG